VILVTELTKLGRSVLTCFKFRFVSSPPAGGTQFLAVPMRQVQRGKHRLRAVRGRGKGPGEIRAKLTSMLILAATLYEQGDLAEARALEEQVLEARARLSVRSTRPH
jgi:hypothetical protein